MKEKKIIMGFWGKIASVLCVYHTAMAVSNFSEGNVDSGIYDACWAVIDGIVVASDTSIIERNN